MKKIETLIKETEEKINGLAYRLADYIQHGDYVCDAISEIVDNDCPVYWSGLIKWFNEESASQDYVNDAVNEYGFDRDFDIFKAFQWGWCKQAEEKIHEEQEEGLLLACYVLIRDSYKLAEITEDQVEEIEDIDFDRIDRFQELKDKIEEIINENNED